MTNRTNPLPIPGVGVRFGVPNTPAYLDRTPNRTPCLSEPNSETEHGRTEHRPRTEPNTPADGVHQFGRVHECT
jgi:hypothetical protein